MNISSEKITSSIKYGCQILKNGIPDYANNWFKKHISNKAPIIVPVRRNCLTGSGLEARCHWNVSNLVKIYGGKILNGYCIETLTTNNQLSVEFTHHSVWLTKEGKAVDVTAHNFTQDDHVWFIPMKEELKPSHLYASICLYKDYKKRGVLLNYGVVFP